MEGIRTKPDTAGCNVMPPLATSRTRRKADFAGISQDRFQIARHTTGTSVIMPEAVSTPGVK
jgi:hypothetical protein